MVRTRGVMASLTFIGVAGLHVSWGRGSSFPFREADDLADAVVGAPSVPPPAACYSVAVALVAAAALAVDLPVAPRRLRRLGRLAAAGVLTARGLLGLAGRTDLMAPGSASKRFRRNDRRAFAPLCLLLAAATATAVPRVRPTVAARGLRAGRHGPVIAGGRPRALGATLEGG